MLGLKEDPQSKFTLLERKKIAIVLLFLITASLLGIDLYLPSMTSISSYFNISPRITQLTITIFLLGFGVAQLIYGPLSDYYGRKKIMLIGLSIALIGSGLCIISMNIYWLLFARFLSGAGSGVVWVLQRAITRDVFKGNELIKVASYIALIWAVTLALAPAIGGHVQFYLGWRLNFVVLTAYIALAIFLTKAYLVETKLEKTNKKPTFLLMTKTYSEVFKNKQFLRYILICTLGFGALMIYNALSPFIFMKGFGLNSIQYGWLGIYVSVTYIFSTGLNSKIATKFGFNNMLLLGFFLMLAGGICLLLASFFNISHVPAIMLIIALFVAGVAFICPNATVGTLTSIDSNFGIASALYGTIQMIGSTLLVFISSHFFASTILTLGSAIIVIFLATIFLFSLNKKSTQSKSSFS